MKNLLIASLFVAFASNASAQGNINKGDWMAGGNAGFNHTKEGDLKTTSIELSPNVGYFFMNNLAGGLRMGIGSEKQEINSNESTMSGFHVGPFARYYFLPGTQKINVFADAMYGFGQTKHESDLGEGKAKYSQFGIMAGPAIFLTPSTALEIGVGYNSQKVKDADDASNTIGVNIGFQIHLGGNGAKKK